MMLAKIGATFPNLGDPYAIPMSRLPGLYSDSERVNAWRLGQADPVTPESARHQALVEEMRRMAKRGKIAPPDDPGSAAGPTVDSHVNPPTGPAPLSASADLPNADSPGPTYGTPALKLNAGLG